jgi:hypothetical protein
MEAVRFSETLVCTYKSTRRYIDKDPEDDWKNSKHVANMTAWNDNNYINFLCCEGNLKLAVCILH